MRVVLLGTGTSTGVPVIGCSCDVCRSPFTENNRFRTSLALVDSQNKALVIDTSPEFRLQMLRARIQELHAVLYTHVHADHCHGFDDLRAFGFTRKDAIPCYLGREYFQEFKTRFSYAFEDTGYLGAKPSVEVREISEDSFNVGGMSIEAIKLPHGNAVSYGFRVGDFAYVTDFKQFSPEQIKAWKGKIRIMVASGIHFGAHKTHSTIPETIALFEQLGVEKGILTHLAHDVDHFRDAHRLPDHVVFGYDGMTFDIQIESIES